MVITTANCRGKANARGTDADTHTHTNMHAHGACSGVQMCMWRYTVELYSYSHCPASYSFSDSTPMKHVDCPNHDPKETVHILWVCVRESRERGILTKQTNAVSSNWFYPYKD